MGQPYRAGPQRAFTLIELLVVIGIIGLLIAIGLVMGRSVRSGGQSRATEDTIRLLDQSLVAYESAKQELPPARLVYNDLAMGTAPRNQFEFVLFDGRLATAKDGKKSDPAVPTVARYTAMCSTVPEADAQVRSINSKFVRRVELDPGLKTQPAAVEVIDAFGEPIRFVHPSFDGGSGDAYLPDGSSVTRLPSKDIAEMRAGSTTKSDYRRSARPYGASASGAPDPVGDADEGICPGRRPYFYSAGPDGDPGTRENNVYTTKPTYPTETAKIP